MIRATLTLLILCTLLSTCAAQVIETGKFNFYETKQIRGEESYSISQSAGGELLVQANTTIPYAEQEAKPLVNATLRTSTDSSPRAFEIKGPTLLELEENTSIQITRGRANVRDRGRNETVNVPSVYF